MLDKPPLRQWPSETLTPHTKCCHHVPWTSFVRSQQHAIHPPSHSSTRNSKTQNMTYYGRTMYTMLWTHHPENQVTACTEKNIQDYWQGKQITMSADRVKPAYILEETWHSTTTNTSNSPTQPHGAPVADATPATQVLRTTSSSRSIHFPACFNTHVLFSGGRGRVIWEQPTNSEWPFPCKCPASANLQYTVSCSSHCCGWRQLLVNLSIAALAPPPQHIHRTCILWLNQCTCEHQK